MYESTPGWSYKFWKNLTTSMTNDISLHSDYLNLTKLSDCARMFLLFKFGGVYADTDIICLKPFSKLFETNRADCFLALETEIYKDQVGNSMISSIPQSRSMFLQSVNFDTFLKVEVRMRHALLSARNSQNSFADRIQKFKTVMQILLFFSEKDYFEHSI